MEDLSTYEKIQQAALEEFLEKGFRGASLRYIVKQAGVTTGAFYGYFSSKEALFASIVEPHAIALIAEMFVSEVSADRIREIYETPAAEGAETFNPDGHDIVFDNVSFSYGNGAVLNGVASASLQRKAR